MEGLNPFLARHKENADMNQYWYSKPTIQFMVSQVEQFCADGKKCAFLSVPSIYFSLKDKNVKAACKCLDVSIYRLTIFQFDTKFAKDPNFVFYDFNKNEDIPEDLRKSFDLVVIDPPFITREVWEKYAEAS